MLSSKWLLLHRANKATPLRANLIERKMVTTIRMVAVVKTKMKEETNGNLRVEEARMMTRIVDCCLSIGDVSQTDLASKTESQFGSKTTQHSKMKIKQRFRPSIGPSPP